MHDKYIYTRISPVGLRELLGIKFCKPTVQEQRAQDLAVEGLELNASSLGFWVHGSRRCVLNYLRQPCRCPGCQGELLRLSGRNSGPGFPVKSFKAPRILQPV